MSLLGGGLVVQGKLCEVVADMLARRTRGDSLEEIGLAYGVTKQAISRLFKTHMPELSKAKANADEVRQSDLEKVMDLSRAGLPYGQIARELEMSRGRVKYLLSARTARFQHAPDR
jgi:hypothetical protein